MTYRIGQMVRIVKSPYPNRVGEVHRVAGSGESGEFWRYFGIPDGTPLVVLDAKSTIRPGVPLGYPADYLEPYHEPGDHASLAELLRSIKGVPAKEKA